MSRERVRKPHHFFFWFLGVIFGFLLTVGLIAFGVYWAYSSVNLQKVEKTFGVNLSDIPDDIKTKTIKDIIPMISETSNLTVAEFCDRYDINISFKVEVGEDEHGTALYVDFEEAFKKHVHWDKHLPDPYFVRASDKLIAKFADCTVKGMTISASGFYGPQGRVVRQGLAMPNMLEDFETFEFDGYKITNFEMEGSALAGMSAKLGHNAGTVCCAIAHRYLKDANTDYKPRVKELVVLALDRLTR